MHTGIYVYKNYSHMIMHQGMVYILIDTSMLYLEQQETSTSKIP